MTTQEKTMRLYTSNYQNHKTFSAFPVSKDSAYANFMYDPVTKHLALIGTIMKHGFVYEDKLDGNGFQEEVNGQKANQLRAQHGKQLYPFKRERLASQVTNDYLITEKEEQIEIIKRFCENADTFDFGAYLNAEPVVIQPQMSPEQQMTNLTALLEGAKESGAEVLSITQQQEVKK